MVLEKIGNAFKNALNKITSSVFIDKKLVNEIIRELQRALIESDVDLGLIIQLSEKIKQQSKRDVSGLEKKELLLKLLHDELIEILGKKKYELKIEKKPHKIMFIGLYGSGKTTTIAKVAFYYKKRGFKVCVLGLDVHREAAPEQLEQLAEKVKVSYFINKTEKNPEKIFEKYKEDIKKFDIVLIDTAGRDSLNEKLIKEISSLYRKIKPQSVILVVPADIGQTAKKQATEFKRVCNIDGIIVTRADGTAKAGGALTSCKEAGAKIFFLGVGEKIQDLEEYNPVSFVSRLLGYGDLQTLLEKARMAIEEKEKKKLEKRFEEGKFTLDDLYEQIKAMQRMGPLSKLTELIPGISKIKIPKELLQVQEDKIKKWRYAIDSMTPEERENPEILNTKRIQRISKGSNVPTTDIRQLIKQYRIVKEFFSGKEVSEKDLKKIARKFRGKLPRDFRI